MTATGDGNECMFYLKFYLFLRTEDHSLAIVAQVVEDHIVVIHLLAVKNITDVIESEYGTTSWPTRARVRVRRLGVVQ